MIHTLDILGGELIVPKNIQAQPGYCLAVVAVLKHSLNFVNIAPVDAFVDNKASAGIIFTECCALRVPPHYNGQL